MKNLLLLSFLFITSCRQNSIETRYNLIDSLNSNKFNKKIYTTSYFNIYSLEKISNEGKLIIYIEGDGVSWIDRFTISSNPTPNNPTAFKLALIDENDNVIYLARPCQFEWYARRQFPSSEMPWVCARGWGCWVYQTSGHLQLHLVWPLKP